MRIDADVLKALRLLADAQRARQDLNLLCTVEAGPACRLADGDWSDSRLSGIAPRLIAGIGYKTIEHAPARTVEVRIPASGAMCRIDLGDGFQPLEVSDE
jgi:hypothetical protein